ncbi:hypothetical protein [Pseudomonas sp.]|nr:hypothetical protein [Pseudomonas sp.]
MSVAMAAPPILKTHAFSVMFAIWLLAWVCGILSTPSTPSTPSRPPRQGG